MNALTAVQLYEPYDDDIDWSDPFDPRTWHINPDVASDLPYTWITRGPEHNQHLVFYSKADQDLLDAYAWNISANRIKGYLARRFKADGMWRIQYFHRAVMLRHAKPLTPRHCLVDHMNGNGFDNRRTNLRWATVSQNNRNRHGFIVQQSTFDFVKDE